MRARLKIEIKSSATRASASLLQREYFGMLDAIVSVSSRSGFFPRGIDNDRADCGIWRDESDSGPRQIERTPRELFVGCHGTF
jgi:hypothetical protein